MKKIFFEEIVEKEINFVLCFEKFFEEILKKLLKKFIWLLEKFFS